MLTLASLALFPKICYSLLTSTILACLFVDQLEQGCSRAMMRVLVDYRVVVASPTLLTTRYGCPLCHDTVSTNKEDILCPTMSSEALSPSILLPEAVDANGVENQPRYN